jgi:hypothetical protein
MNSSRSVRTGLLIAAFAAGIGAPASVVAQGVLVAPPGVFIDHRSRSGSLELYNPNLVPAEVTISTIFGYPVTDSTGQLSLLTRENPDSTAPSAAAWVQAYPRRLVLAPNARQTVRLLGRPPATLADGEYWTRLVIAAKTGPAPADAVTDTAAIRVGLAFEVRTVIGVWYRKGAVTTGVQLKDMSVSMRADSVAVKVALERQGNAAFLGMFRAVVSNATGKEIATLDRQVAVYYALDPVYTIPVGNLSPGTYTVRVEISTDRSDFQSGVLVAPSVRAERTITIPSGSSPP